MIGHGEPLVADLVQELVQRLAVALQFSGLRDGEIAELSVVNAESFQV
jgi:hypothetical protein